MGTSFSKRHGYEPEITVRDDAPPELKEYFLHLVYGIGLPPETLETIICQALKKLPKPRVQWPGITNVKRYNTEYLNECSWNKVYDVIEMVAKHYHQGGFLDGAFHRYQDDLNEFFVEHGIGWKLVDAHIEARGSEPFEGALKTAKDAMGKARHNTAERELVCPGLS
ncbi:AbiJ-NTD4 domain-containing protein, partial [Pseudomonas aeruginosa]